MRGWWREICRSGAAGRLRAAAALRVRRCATGLSRGAVRHRGAPGAAVPEPAGLPVVHAAVLRMTRPCGRCCWRTRSGARCGWPGRWVSRWPGRCGALCRRPVGGLVHCCSYRCRRRGVRSGRGGTTRCGGWRWLRPASCAGRARRPGCSRCCGSGGKWPTSRVSAARQRRGESNGGPGGRSRGGTAAGRRQPAVLVDDLMTTGASLAEAARAVRAAAAGARCAALLI